MGKKIWAFITGKKIYFLVLLALVLALKLVFLLPLKDAVGGYNKWNTLEFELIKLLLQLVIVGIIGALLLEDNSERRKKEEASNEFRKDLLESLVKSYHKAKRARRILRANIISADQPTKIGRKAYEEQMRVIIDAQLGFEYYGIQLGSFPKVFEKHSSTLKTHAKNLEGYLSDLIAEYEKSGGADEFISITELPTLKAFFAKDQFKEGFADDFHSSANLVLEEIL